MLLRTLLEDPELGLKLLTGKDKLDRPIRWVYTTDLRDPRRYLSGGELVLTGMMWRRAPADSEVFVSALANAGVAVLVAGTARLGSAPRDLVHACQRHSVPLMELPINVSFNSVSDRVVLGIAAERSGQSGPGSSTEQRQLVSAVAEGAEAVEVVRMATEQLGVSCWVLSTTDRVVAEGGQTDPAAESGQALSLTKEQRGKLIERFVGAKHLPAVVELDDLGAVSLFGVGGTGSGRHNERRIASWFLVLTGDYREEPERNYTSHL